MVLEVMIFTTMKSKIKERN